MEDRVNSIRRDTVNDIAQRCLMGGYGCRRAHGVIFLRLFYHLLSILISAIRNDGKNIRRFPGTVIVCVFMTKGCKVRNFPVFFYFIVRRFW